MPNKSFSMGDKAKFIMECLARFGLDSVEEGEVNSSSNSFNWDCTLKTKLKGKIFQFYDVTQKIIMQFLPEK